MPSMTLRRAIAPSFVGMMSRTSNVTTGNNEPKNSHTKKFSAFQYHASQPVNTPATRALARIPAIFVSIPFPPTCQMTIGGNYSRHFA